MALAYTPPGVRVNEVVTPALSPLVAVPSSICLVGKAAGVITKTQLVTLTGTTASTLEVPTGATLGTGAIKLVLDQTNPGLTAGSASVAQGYDAAEYTFNATNKTIARSSSSSDIPDGANVYVVFEYTPADYFLPIRLDNLSDIEDRFGTAWNDAGTAINSPLSHAARIALENGAQTLVLLPVSYNNAGTRQQPTDTQHATTATWADTLTLLRDIEDVNIIVPIIGQSQTSVTNSVVQGVHNAVQDHIAFMKQDEQQYIISIQGQDSSGTTQVPKTGTDSLIVTAQTLAARYGGDLAEQTVVVSPTKFTRALPNTQGEIVVGGQYAAAAVAGMIAARAVSASLTRKAVSGFRTVAESRTKAEMNTEAGSGLCVIEQRGALVQIRHAVTTNTTSSVKREISIIRAKHRVVESVRDTLETQIIGQVIADGNAPLVVRNVVAATLDALRSFGDIVGYSGVQARTLSLDPAHIEVRFSYKPSFPVNYVTVNFSLDLSTGNLSLPSTEIS